ncbi:hypothetical protein TPHA_0D02970 [Tetrapisispora phaffii CBS 4417]|uniref:Flavin reductase like domain-containing protein n=1 Tax=Tetrapisispora phaffii (strain ATCC 24235 / CBS 4417 / NBRC 1672 / NRRL Y-8282 / UCD 70-5) TaxID=1071381 RepID=G8BSW2_TETPH|nr:hypothetical protein TPHA_0D02970 [Tetrapisispora phaffii CBS 4417]CCE62933.1 hypothetical protein TPHA_0D02970 [Tetrapisispora phaffii CBS 4417]
MLKTTHFVRYNSTIHKHVITQDRFKETMRKMATQVMLLSIANPIGSPKSEFRGLVASSVTSLCVLPKPKLEFNLQLPSFTSIALHKYQYFAVHIMSPTKASVDMGRLFSKGAITSKMDGSIQPSQPFMDLEENVTFENYSIENSNLQIPVLKMAEKTLICKKSDVFKTGDHEIWVGEVEDIIVNEEEEAQGGLLYYDRFFHMLGNKIQ